MTYLCLSRIQSRCIINTYNIINLFQRLDKDYSINIPKHSRRCFPKWRIGLSFFLVRTHCLTFFGSQPYNIVCSLLQLRDCDKSPAGSLHKISFLINCERQQRFHIEKQMQNIIYSFTWDTHRSGNHTHLQCFTTKS